MVLRVLAALAVWGCVATAWADDKNVSREIDELKAQVAEHQAKVAELTAVIAKLEARVAELKAKLKGPDRPLEEIEIEKYGANPGSIESSGLAVEAGDKLEVGQYVQLHWGGSWWLARVLKVNKDDTFEVHYVGWAHSWDEVVGRDRLQRMPEEKKEKTGSSDDSNDK